MKTSRLRQQPYSKVPLMRLLVGVIRFLFDLPALFFLLTDEVRSRP